ncbi:hypothetical protein D3C73_1500020 [compost metagenome]
MIRACMRSPRNAEAKPSPAPMMRAITVGQKDSCVPKNTAVPANAPGMKESGAQPACRHMASAARATATASTPGNCTQVVRSATSQP